MQCPTCGSDKIRNKGFSSDGSKRYKCKACNTPFTSKAINEASIAPIAHVHSSPADIKTGEYEELKLTNVGNVGNDVILQNAGNILVFSCVHLPFEKKGYIDFLHRIKEEYKCNTIINLGDFVDSHAMSKHDHSPDGFGAGHEILKVIDKIQDWKKIFPKMYITMGNHDKLPYRQAYSNGLPKSVIKSFKEIYEMPDGWVLCDRVIADGVVFSHGTGKSGEYAAKAWMLDNRKSSCIGHIHTSLSVQYVASRWDRLFAMSVGCGIDQSTYAAEYAKDFGRRQLIGCGVVLNNGQLPIAIPMPL